MPASSLTHPREAEARMLDIPSPSIAPTEVWRQGEEAGALVFGGAHGSLSVVRSLGRRGIPVWLLRRDHPIARLSRYASGSIPWKDRRRANAADYLVEIAERYQPEGRGAVSRRRRRGRARLAEPRQAFARVPRHHPALVDRQMGLRQAPDERARRRARHRASVEPLPARPAGSRSAAVPLSRDSEARDEARAQRLHARQGLARRQPRRSYSPATTKPPRSSAPRASYCRS